ncbi:hypothetical protein AX16_010045 [Volvariella volvacea WC 439]|nr:hypothetical protein AX16_010045 [Volvariella volvacea WC 439]
MRLFSLLSVFGLCASAVAQSSIEDFIAFEKPIAKAGILANIGPSGSKSQGAKAGVVIASPSKVDPDYVYTWTRDASLVFKFLIDQYTLGEDQSASLRNLIDLFVASQKRIQQVSNPSGTVSTGGLGEPKFNIDETAFTGAWGRPQRDGPPLRATALIGYANWLWANSNSSYILEPNWASPRCSIGYIRLLTDYSSFDLWEEVSSSSFFTTSAQHRALREGAALARKVGQTSLATNYETQAANALCFLQSYWNPSATFVTSNTGGGRSGKDANSALASIHAFDAAAGCDPITFQPCSDKALASLKVYVDAFRSIYPINSGIPANQAVATGRYPEDVYYGGQPWYLTTAAVAEQLYDALIVWNQQGSLQVTSTSLAFFRQLSPSITTGTYPASSSTFTTLTAAVKAYADGFLAVIRTYTPADGSLAEQYHRNDGHPLSAKDLTWSYAAILTAFGARAGTVPASWGAAGLTLPSVCAGNQGPLIDLTFKVQATTVWGENIFVTGNVDALSGWSPDNAIALNANNYPIWEVTIRAPASTNIEYKYIRKYNGQVTWESDPNRSFTTPASGSYTLNDSWR